MIFSPHSTPPIKGSYKTEWKYWIGQKVRSVLFLKNFLVNSIYIQTLTEVVYNLHLHFSLKKFYLFIYFWLCWVFIAEWAFSSCSKWGLHSSCGRLASHCSGLPCCKPCALGRLSSVTVAPGL